MERHEAMKARNNSMRGERCESKSRGEGRKCEEESKGGARKGGNAVECFGLSDG